MLLLRLRSLVACGLRRIETITIEGSIVGDFLGYPAGEGQAYVVGGLTASYLRKGDVVLIPIRMGAGLRLGVNAGYMKFSKKQRWLPF